MRWLTRLWSTAKRKPWSAHLLRAGDRFVNRMGNQLAGGVTYFSVLAMFPVLMSAFSVLGLTLTVIRPDWLISWRNRAVSEIGDVVGGDKAVALFDRALSDWRTVGLVGVLSAIYAGSGWMGCLRGAVRAQWRPDFDWNPPGRHWAVERLVNLLYFILLLFFVGVSFAMTTLGNQLADWLVALLGLAGRPGVEQALQVGAFALATLTGWLMFMFLYRVLPQYQAPTHYLVKGSLGAAIALALLQMLTTYLIARFSRTLSVIVFGNVIIVMLFFNLFARLTLFAAAWIATGYQPALPRQYSETDLPLRGRPGVVTVTDHWAFADADRDQRERGREAAGAAARREVDARRLPLPHPGSHLDGADEAQRRREAAMAATPAASRASQSIRHHDRSTRTARHPETPIFEKSEADEKSLAEPLTTTREDDEGPHEGSTS